MCIAASACCGNRSNRPDQHPAGQQNQEPDMENRSSINNLRNLSGDLQMAAAVETPVDLAPNVLMRVGLADVYWTVVTAIGQVFIAASDRGISGVAGGTDSAA